MIGVIFAKIFYSAHKIELTVGEGDKFQALLLEILGSFFLVFMYLSSTEEKTKFTKDKAVQTIILAGSYLGAMLIAGVKLQFLDASPVNPAIAIAIHFTNLAEGSSWSSIWIFGGASFLGSFLSLMFFTFVYKKTQEVMEDIEDEEEHNQEALLDD